MKIWLISREYAGIAEAGGVKNVTCSLCEGLHKLGEDVTLFIPQYGCTSLNHVHDYQELDLKLEISIGNSLYEVSYSKGICNGVPIVFVISPLFLEKKGVYTYTSEEERLNPLHEKGTGHHEALIMNVLFQRAVLAYGLNFQIIPEVIHCQDAATALIPFLAREDFHYRDLYLNTNFLVTIHNAGPGYHHNFFNIDHAMFLTGLSYESLKKGLLGEAIEPFILSSLYATLTTVSPWYADELLDPHNSFTEGLSKYFSEHSISIVGITNGIDYEKYNPTNIIQSYLPYAFNPEINDLEGKHRLKKEFLTSYTEKKDILPGIEQFGVFETIDPDKTVLFSFHGRIVWQKGVDVILDAWEHILDKYNNVLLVINGQGQQDIEEKIIAMTKRFSGKIVYFRGYHRSLARETVAAGDFIVLPSHFEPCGLEDFIAQIFGTIPIAHKKGGLQKILSGKTGFTYEPNSNDELSSVLLDKIHWFQTEKDAVLRLIVDAANYVHSEYNWEYVIQHHYIPLYKKNSKKKIIFF